MKCQKHLGSPSRSPCPAACRTVPDDIFKLTDQKNWETHCCIIKFAKKCGRLRDDRKRLGQSFLFGSSALAMACLRSKRHTTEKITIPIKTHKITIILSVLWCFWVFSFFCFGSIGISSLQRESPHKLQ